MFDPKKMISPFQSAVKAVDSKDLIYRLLIDKYNTVVNKVYHQNNRANTLATCTQIDTDTGKPFTRDIEYDRLDIGLWSKQNTEEYIDELDIRRRLLISGCVNKTSIDVGVAALTKTLYNDHHILISEADLTYGKNRTYLTVDTDFGKAYNLINCITYKNVVSYTSGKIVVNHCNVGRKTPLPYNGKMMLGFNLIRTNQPGESIQLRLPVVTDTDNWNVLIEGVDNFINTGPGALWLKIQLSEFSDYWTIYDANGTVGTFDATEVNILTLELVEGALVVRGKSVNGESQELQFEPQEPINEHIFQRITAYSRNPYTTRFQLEINSTGIEEPVEVDVNLAVNNTIYAHPLSNALTGRIDVPLTLSDLRAVNYREVAQHTYRTKPTQTFEYGSIDRVMLMDDDKTLLVNIKIVDLPNLIRSNKISKLVFDSYSLVKNGYEYGTYVYEIRSVDLENETMHLVMTYRGDVIHEDPVAPLPTQDTFEFQISWQYSNVMYNQATFDLGRPLNDILQSVNKQQNFKVTIYMKSKQALPEVIYTKSMSDLIIG